MKHIISLLFFIVFFLISIYAQKLSLDGEWKFAQGDNKDNSSSAFNDADWKIVDAGALRWDKKSAF